MPTYGTLLHTVDLGTKGNETHHWGYTDDRTKIWAGGLFSSRIWILDVATDPAKPRIEKVHREHPRVSGSVGPAQLLRVAGSDADQLSSDRPAADCRPGWPSSPTTASSSAGSRIPTAAPYGYDVAIKPALNRMVTSSFTPLRNYTKPLAKMDLKDFGSELVVWDFKNRQPLQVGKAGLAPLEVRWSLKPENNYGFTNCALDNSLWLFKGNGEGTYDFKKVADTGALPADLRQSPDDKYLYVSCFGDNLIQQWDVSDPEHLKLKSTVAPCVQPNMMHVTGDGKRMYVSNSLLSTLDHSGRFCVRLVHVGPDGMKVDPFFNIDLNQFKTGPARGHDMLIN